MKILVRSILVATLSLFSMSAFSQTEGDTTLLGLPGDNLDLYAVLDLFQKSKTIEEFEKSLNLEKTGINNLDLDLDKKVDFIKVVTQNEGDDFSFILQVAVSKTENQDVAVILVSKDENKKITMQIVGDPDLYGKDYIVELKETKKPAVTANPAYQGTDKVESTPAKTETIVVESAPIVQYVYSPVYVPYYPPYYYGYYPPYYSPFAVMSVGIYIGYHSHYHYGGYGYHGNTVVIHNHNHYNNYNNSRNRSNTVNNNIKGGNYKGGNTASTRPSTRQSTGVSPSTRQSNSGPRQSNLPSSKQSSAGSRQSTGVSPSTRQSGNYNTQQTRPSSNGASRYSGGGNTRTSGSSGGFGGGGSRGGGGRGRGR